MHGQGSGVYFVGMFGGGGFPVSMITCSALPRLAKETAKPRTKSRTKQEPFSEERVS